MLVGSGNTKDAMSEQSYRLLIVEDDPGLLSQLRWCFEDYDVCTAGDRESAIAELRCHEPAVVLQDLGLPPRPDSVEEGLLTLGEILKLAPHTKVIVVTGHGDQHNALTAVGQGAYDFYEKPVDTDTLKLIVERAFSISYLEAENRRLQDVASDSPLDGIVAASEGMLAVCRMIEKVAPTDVTTLLLGESGTGKELLARSLHRLSPRKDNAFVAINCAAIPENLLESELFGHEKGAFTGAVKTTPGKVELAGGGPVETIEEPGPGAPVVVECISEGHAEGNRVQPQLVGEVDQRERGVRVVDAEIRRQQRDRLKVRLGAKPPAISGVVLLIDVLVAPDAAQIAAFCQHHVGSGFDAGSQ